MLSLHRLLLADDVRMSLGSAHVLCFQELPLSCLQQWQYMFSDFHVLCNDDTCSRPGHGLVVMVRKKYQCQIMHHSTYILSVRISDPLNPCFPPFYVANTYIPPHGKTHLAGALKPIWADLGEYVGHLQTIFPVLVVGDFNTTSSFNNRHFMNFKKKYDLSHIDCLANTCHTASGHFSCVDYILASQLMLPIVEFHGPSYFAFNPSDHLPMSCTLHIPLSTLNVHKPAFLSNDICHYRWSPEAQPILLEYIINALNPFQKLDSCELDLPYDDVNDIQAWLSDILYNAGSQAHLIKRFDDPVPPLHHKPPTLHLPQHARFIKKQILFLTRRGCTSHTPNLVRHLRHQFKKHVKWAKVRLSWYRGRLFQSYLRFQGKKFWKPWHQRALSLVQASQIPLTRWKQHYTNLFTESSHSLDRSLDKYIRHIPTDRRQQVHDAIMGEFTAGEILEAVMRFNNAAAQGADHIPTQLLSIHVKSPTHGVRYPVLDALLPFFNCVLSTHKMPDIWNISIINPIFKKGDSDMPNNFRPISLSSCLYRLFMAAMTHRVSDALKQYHILPDTQFAFTQDRNAEQAATTLHQAILSQEGGTVVAAFIDLKQAYDRVQHNMLFHVLEKTGLPCDFIDIVQKAYASAQFTIRTAAGFTDLVPYTRGLRQGCPMSPLLFNLYFGVVDQWLNKWVPFLGIDVGFHESLLRAVYYADDVVLLATSVVDLQRLVNRFEQCASRLHMLINPDKSSLLVFNNHNNVQGQLSVESGIIRQANQYIYLGVVFSTDMNWGLAQHHREQLADKQFQAVVAYLKSQHLSNALVTGTHFNQNIMQTMLYGVGVWGWEFFSSWDWIHNPFQRKQAKLFRVILHLPINTPIAAIMCESGLWPILYYAIKHAVKHVQDLSRAGSRMLDHLVGLDVHDGIMQRYQSFLQVVSPNDPLDQPGLVLDKVVDIYLDKLHGLAHDPRVADDNGRHHRKVSTYFQWMWNGRLHSRPKFYYVDLDHDIYMTGIRTRLMDAALPVYMRYKTRYDQCICPLCHVGPCDLRHVFVDCHELSCLRDYHLAWLGGQKLRFPELFTSGDPHVWTYVHRVISQFRGLCSYPRGRRSEIED